MASWAKEEALAGHVVAGPASRKGKGWGRRDDEEEAVARRAALEAWGKDTVTVAGLPRPKPAPAQEGEGKAASEAPAAVELNPAAVEVVADGANTVVSAEKDESEEEDEVVAKTTADVDAGGADEAPVDPRLAAVRLAAAAFARGVYTGPRIVPAAPPAPAPASSASAEAASGSAPSPRPAVAGSAKAAAAAPRAAKPAVATAATPTASEGSSAVPSGASSGGAGGGLEREVRRASRLVEEMGAASEAGQWARLLELLGKAAALDVSLALLQQCTIGKVVKKLAKVADATCAAKADAIVRKWKAALA
jgi:hypothetical protein